jgi:aryl-alcohol dehydrogenase-like predicted oxidoreductase
MRANFDLISLGSTDIKISPLGIGAWSWGDRFFWNFGNGYDKNDVQAAIESTLSAGINFFDTAESYGRGKSEEMIGELIVKKAHPAIIATKFFPYPWRIRSSSLINSLRKSIDRLGVKQVGLYQVHWPFPPRSVETWAAALADAVELGLTRAVGVSNYNTDQLRRAHAVLAKRGVLLASNQVEYHLLNRKIEKNGLLDICHEMGISLIAYSPLGQGILTGKYSPENPMKGVRGRRYSSTYLGQIQPLIQLLEEIGHEQGDKPPSQVALNWVIQKGAIPIPGAKNARQAEDNAGALGWSLSEDEVARLDQISDQISES